MVVSRGFKVVQNRGNLNVLTRGAVALWKTGTNEPNEIKKTIIFLLHSELSKVLEFMV